MRRLSLLVLAAAAAGSLPLGCTPSVDTDSSATEAPKLTPWAHALKGTLSPTALASGPHGDLLLGGTFTGEANFGGGLLDAVGDNSLFLAHLDAEGDHLMSGSTGAQDALWSVAIGPEDDLYAVGDVDGLASFGAGQLDGDKDGYLAAFDADDEPFFSRQIIGEISIFTDRVVTTKQGRVVVAARTDDTADFGNGPPLYGQGSPQMVVAEYEKDGTLLWDQRIPGTGIYPLALAVDEDGNVYLGGDTYSPVVLGSWTLDFGMFIAKLDPEGTPLWLRGASHDTMPVVHDLATDEDGNLYLSGNYYYGSFSIGGVQLPPSQTVNAYVIKMTPDGNGVWSKAFLLSNYTGFIEIAPAKGGDVLVALTAPGLTDLGGGTLGSPNGDNHGFLGRFGPDGAHRKSMVLSGYGQSWIYDLAADPAGHPVLLGGFDNVLDIGDDHLVSDSGTTSFVARMAF